MDKYDDDRSMFDELGSFVVKDILDVDKDTDKYLSMIMLNTLLFLEVSSENLLDLVSGPEERKQVVHITE